MLRSALPGLLGLGLVALASCAIAPAARSPLQEELAKSDNPTIEQAARACLNKAGWKVDPIGGVSGGANVVTAYKAKEQTDVYIYPPPTKPRITGGPDYEDAFWGCLGRELGGDSHGGSAAPAESAAADAGH